MTSIRIKLIGLSLEVVLKHEKLKKRRSEMWEDKILGCVQSESECGIES